MDPADANPPRRTDGGLPGQVEITNSGANGVSNSGGDWCVTGSSVGNEKRGGDKMAGFPDGLGAMSGVEGAVHCFLLVFVGGA
jgi:hypothetical protein